MLERFAAGSLLLVCSGYSREDVKQCNLGDADPQAAVTGGKNVFTPEALATEICRLSDPGLGRQATPLLRQEYLGFMLSHPRTAGRFPELRRLRRQPGFLRRLDQSVTSARSCALHPEEREVLFERLRETRTPTPVQAEILLLAALWEGWLEDQGLLDSISALHKASQILSTRGLPPSLAFRGGRIWRNEAPEAVEAEFISELGRHVSLVEAAPLGEAAADGVHAAVAAEKWHTIQDSCERLGDRIVEAIRRGIEPSRIVVLIPDSDSPVRLALARVLGERGISELDPRDPLQTRLAEDFKRGLAPLELASSRFERARLVAWLAHEGRMAAPDLAAIESRLVKAGLRRGYGPVRSRLPQNVIDELGRLEDLARRRVSIAGLAQAHLAELRGRCASWMLLWWERFWKDFSSDLALLGLEQERMALALWMVRVRSRFEQTPAPPAALRPSTGIRVIRASQANPGLSELEVHLLGLPAQWLSIGQAGARAADLFFRARDREVLGPEFAVRSGGTIREARIRALKSWIGAARSLCLLEHRFEADGSERESVELILAGLFGGPAAAAIRVEERGAHPRFVGSYALVREARPREVRLPELGDSRISATDLDQMSRCPFLGLVQSRWKLASLEEPDLELWPTTNGNLLHAAAEKLTRELTAGPRPELSKWDSPQLEAACEACWKAAWDEAIAAGRLQGWVPSPQLERQIARRAAGLLKSFALAEIQYRSRSGATLLATEEQARLEWKMESRGRAVTISGKADRIDEHPEGLFVVDYKSGRQELRGSDVREKGYRLQLPYYAIAAQQVFSRQVLGVQFIELTREARRSVGLFPKALNGKAAGSLTQVRSNNASLFDGDPGELWAGLEDRIRATVTRHLDGIHDSLPLMGARECKDCRARAVCGQARRDWVEGEE